MLELCLLFVSLTDDPDLDDSSDYDEEDEDDNDVSLADVSWGASISSAL